MELLLLWGSNRWKTPERPEVNVCSVQCSPSVFPFTHTTHTHTPYTQPSQWRKLTRRRRHHCSVFFLVFFSQLTLITQPFPPSFCCPIIPPSLSPSFTRPFLSALQCFLLSRKKRKRKNHQPNALWSGRASCFPHYTWLHIELHPPFACSFSHGLVNKGQSPAQLAGGTTQISIR